MYHKLSPKYLTSLLPKRTQDKNEYRLRNRNNLQQIKTNSSLYTNSFFPKLTKIWNSMSDDLKFVGSLRDFKSKLCESDKKVPYFYNLSNRTGEIYVSRLRMKCSSLNSHLYRMNIIENPSCACGYHTEDEHHYFFDCPLFDDSRHLIFDLVNEVPLEANTLIYGNERLPKRTLLRMFEKVEEYVLDTGRFKSTK